MTSIMINYKIKIMNLEIIIYSIFVGWLIFLTYSLAKIKSHYNNLVTRTKKKQIDEILDYLLKKNDFLDKNINELKKQILEVATDVNFHFQKIGFLRFKPFEQKGEEGFILGIFDEKNNGILINFIYIRDGLRVYPKIIKNSQGLKYHLTNEEKEVINTSQSLKVLNPNI